MESPCVKYGEHLPHPDPKKPNTCIRCNKSMSDPILTHEEITNGRRKIDQQIVQDNIEQFKRAEVIAKRDNRDVLDIFLEMGRKE